MPDPHERPSDTPPGAERDEPSGTRHSHSGEQVPDDTDAVEEARRDAQQVGTGEEHQDGGSGSQR